MGMYESFAGVYDRFMDDVPYDEWAERIHEILLQHQIKDGLVLDLGCGTGQITRRLRDFGYDMIGIDSSSDMLFVALEKEQGTGEDSDGSGTSGSRILYLEQDMREFELYGTVRAVCSACDCLNYLESEDDLLSVFRLVENYLDPYGVFLFDMNTEYYYREELGQNTFADVRDECSVIWENDYDPVLFENEYDLTIFTRAENGLYRRSRETHFEKAFPFERVKELAEHAGLIFEGVFDGYSEEKLRSDSRRMVLVFTESGRKLCGPSSD